MLSLKSIEAKLKKFEDGAQQDSEAAIVALHKKWGEESKASEQEIQQEIIEALAEARELAEKTKGSRYILYHIYFTLKVKYGRDLAGLAEELLPAVIKGNIEQRELEELRAAISNILEHPTLPPSSSIRRLLEPIIWKYAGRETKEKMLQKIEQRAEEHRRQREAAEQRAEEYRKQREEMEQANLLLQRQLLELEQQLQAKDSQKIIVQPEESSPIGSSSDESAKHSPQHGAIPSSPVITTSFDMSTTRTKQPLLEGELTKEQEQCTPLAKKQCLHPSQDSQP